MESHYVFESLLKELDNKRRYIKKNQVDPDEIEHDFLTEEANQHSARIEKPIALVYDPNIDEEMKLIRRREFDYFKNSLEKAWNFGRNNVNLPLKEEDIKKLAGLIDSNFFESYSDEFSREKIAPYRRITEGVRASGSKYTPPYPAKVPKEMDKFLKNVRDLTDLLKKGQLHPVELASFTHFNLVRIHPFPDANGRTSRMIQDIILRKYNFPAAAIREGERRTYCSLLENAVGGYLSRDNSELFKISDEERRFYTFLVDKVNVSLDYILDKHQIKNISNN